MAAHHAERVAVMFKGMRKQLRAEGIRTQPHHEEENHQHGGYFSLLATHFEVKNSPWYG